MVLTFNPFNGQLENKLKQFKVRAFDPTTLNNFSSNTPTDIPGLALSIVRPGDYDFNCILNLNHDQNEEADLFIALQPINNRTVTLADGSTVNITAGSTYTFDFQAVRDRQQKNQDQTLQGFFVLDNLQNGDIVKFQLDTRNDNTDIELRRAQGTTFA